MSYLKIVWIDFMAMYCKASSDMHFKTGLRKHNYNETVKPHG